MSKRQPKVDTQRDVDGESVRVRVYTTRSECEVLIGEGDIEDPEAAVWCYPKVPGGPAAWVDQAVADWRRDKSNA